MMKVAGLPFAIFDRNPKRARHAKMHEQHFVRGEIGQEIFGASSEGFHGLSRQTPGEVARQWPAQVPALRLHVEESCAFHHWGQAAPDGFDLRKLGHVSLTIAFTPFGSEPAANGPSDSALSRAALWCRQGDMGRMRERSGLR